jgi:hypothetical protein
MNNQIIIGRIFSVIILLPTITAEFLTLATPNAFGQQFMFDKDNNGPALDLTNNNISDSNNDNNNIIAISTTTGTNKTSATPPSNITKTTPTITVSDIINSTYFASTETGSERRIARGVRDRINDVLHTVVMSNATIISNATITNDFLNESITTNNNTRFLETLPDQVFVALERKRVVSQSVNPMLELHTDIKTVCIANSTSLTDCNINIRIR